MRSVLNDYATKLIEKIKEVKTLPFEEMLNIFNIPFQKESPWYIKKREEIKNLLNK